MAISLSFKNEAQYVRITHGLSSTEEAAIRLKLDQKINRGRNKIMIDISQLAIDDVGTVTALQSVLNFANHRGTNTALYGLKRTQWIKVAEGFAGKINLFETENEALKWLASLAENKPKAPKKPSPEEELRQKLIAELLAKYAIYQAQNDYDPFLLTKLREEYEQSPSREPLFALRRAYKKIFNLKDTLQSLEQHCDDLAKQLYEHMKIRKIPLSDSELSAKEAALKDFREAVQNELGEIQKQIDEKMSLAVGFRKRSAAHEERWKQSLDLIQKQIDQETVENKKLFGALGIRP